MVQDYTDGGREPENFEPATNMERCIMFGVAAGK
jgi:hypothetical protein